VAAGVEDVAGEREGQGAVAVAGVGAGGSGWGVVGTDGALSIRRHLWEEDVPHAVGETVRHWSNDAPVGMVVGVEGLPPPLEAGVRFDLVIAADVLYFFEQVRCLPQSYREKIKQYMCGGKKKGLPNVSTSQQVEPLLHTIAARLAPGGVAMMTVTLRRPAVYARFIDGLADVGLELIKARGAGEIMLLDNPSSDLLAIGL
jgi:hypothetical protein